MRFVCRLQLAVPLFAAIGILFAGVPSIAEQSSPPTSNQDAQPAYSAMGSDISYFNTPNRHHTTITGAEPAILGKVSIDIEKQSDVLVQFTSGLATTSDEGCPCSFRASLKADDREPIVIKRINLGAHPTQPADQYVPDRQSLDGSFVFSLPKGQHELSLIVQRVDGTAKDAQAFYTNIQALIFTRK